MLAIYGLHSESIFGKKIQKKMQFLTILFPYKMCVTEKRTKVKTPIIGSMPTLLTLYLITLIQLVIHNLLMKSIKRGMYVLRFFFGFLLFLVASSGDKKTTTKSQSKMFFVDIVTIVSF